MRFHYWWFITFLKITRISEIGLLVQEFHFLNLMTNLNRGEERNESTGVWLTSAWRFAIQRFAVLQALGCKVLWERTAATFQIFSRWIAARKESSVSYGHARRSWIACYLEKRLAQTRVGYNLLLGRWHRAARKKTPAKQLWLNLRSVKRCAASH